MVALEIERLLTNAGEVVETVGLLDTWMPRRGGAGGTVATPATDRADVRPARTRGRALVMNHVTRVLRSEVRLTRRVSKRVHALLAGVVPFPGQAQFDAFFDMGVMVGDRYRLRPTHAPAVLVLAENNPDDPRAWADILRGPVHRIDLPCEHTSVLREPHVAVLAAALNPELPRPVK